MKQTMYNHANGIVIDNLGELNATVKDFAGERSCANRILDYVIAAPISGGIEP